MTPPLRATRREGDAGFSHSCMRSCHRRQTICANIGVEQAWHWQLNARRAHTGTTLLVFAVEVQIAGFRMHRERTPKRFTRLGCCQQPVATNDGESRLLCPAGLEQNHKRSSNDMRRLYEQWLEGARGSLRQKQRTPPKRERTDRIRRPRRRPPRRGERLSTKRRRATTLPKEGQLSKACSVLLDEPPAPFSENVAKVTHFLHRSELRQKATSKVPLSPPTDTARVRGPKTVVLPSPTPSKRWLQKHDNDEKRWTWRTPSTKLTGPCLSHGA